MDATKKILQSLLNSSTPLSISELLQQHPDTSRRTLQRKLSEWISEEKIHVIGKGRSRKYTARTEAEESTDSSLLADYIPLSADSKEILDYLQRPFSSRHPVSYQRDFIESYRPNKTFYLPAPLRKQLLRMGQTEQETQPAGTYGRAIFNRLLIDLSWASSHLEGNTYSRLDTVKLIEQGQEAAGKATLEAQMILNHKTAIELLIDNAEDASMNRFMVLNLHSALSENLLPNPADEGRIRHHQVEIGKSVFKPLAGERVLSELLDLLLQKADAIKDPLEQSFFMMVHLPYLQPFADVNKRTSRLAANLPLIKANLCPMTFLGVPVEAYSRATLGVYEMTRVEMLRDLYLWAYERSTQEYLAIKQQLVAPDPLRLQYRNLIKQVVHEVVLSPDNDPVELIEKLIPATLDGISKQDFSALIIEELRRLHEGVLARYGLRPSQFKQWKLKQS
ncbi:Fic family protein [Endozoicomonas arenosclerae]|uniref:Fic family protein n=1 Tax=Endozoicomonas arenosclerae TaxID=1633495 RepID=UPI0007860A41|nr:Fic family protein [Endozoicomonas arenosclerae]